MRMANILVDNDKLLRTRIAHFDDFSFGSTFESEINYTRRVRQAHRAHNGHIHLNWNQFRKCVQLLWRRAQIAFHFTSICNSHGAHIANDFSCFIFTTIWNWCMARVAIDLFMQYYYSLSTAGARWRSYSFAIFTSKPKDLLSHFNIK